MKRFFESIESLHKFTMNLDCRRHLVCCSNCCCSDYLVSHGFVYASDSSAVGKRLFCSNRYGRNGCGATIQLYIKDRIPGMRYSAACVTIFVMALIAGLCIEEAYFKATQSDDVSNGFRWVDRLYRRLSDYRIRISGWRRDYADGFRSRVRRLRQVLSTLAFLFSKTDIVCAADFQLGFQKSFF